MTRMKRMTLISSAAALVLAAAAGAGLAVDQGPRQDGYQAALARIDQQRRKDDAGCTRLKDNALEVCKLQAEGREKVARAQLQAQRKPSPDAEKAVKRAKAEADYRVARQRCAASANKDACIEQAKDTRAAAIRLATVEKVRHMAELKSRAEDERRGGKEDSDGKLQTPAARFASVKAYCEMQGPDRDRCLAEAKRRFHRS
jgi:hypothetical protein